MAKEESKEFEEFEEGSQEALGGVRVLLEGVALERGKGSRGINFSAGKAK